MKKVFENLGMLGLAVVFAYWLAAPGCFQQKGPDIVRRDTVTVIQDRWVVSLPIVHNYSSFHTDSVYMPVQGTGKVDTAGIMRMYFTEYTYRDTLRDTNITLAVTAKLLHNRITEKQYQYKIRSPVLNHYITEQVEVKKPKLLVGLSMGTDFKSGGRNAVSPQLIFINKKSVAISCGYEVVNRFPHIGFYIPIKQ